MANITIKKLAQELNLSVGTVSKALRDSHEISIETKRKVNELVNKLNFIPNPYASSLRKRKSKTIAVVLPEVADSFFSLAINGIEAVAQEKGYHVLIYLTHESFLKEENILKDFKSGRVDGILISVSRETTKGDHIGEVQTLGMPVVFFDRVCDEVETAKVTTNDFESGYEATNHLIGKGCKQITYLSISATLSIANKRMEGYYKAMIDHNIQVKENSVVFCTNNEKDNYTILKKLMSSKDQPDGLIASVEKLTITVYHVCKELDLQIPQDVKVVSFSNLASALILNPSLTTITQPAFEMGKAAASLLFNALEKRNFILKQENVILPSVLNVRNSTGFNNL
jgi:LacI family transcriptional regulator